MEPAINSQQQDAQVKTVAAVDIGSNSVRMAVAEVTPDGRVEVLEQLQRAARLGQDTFRRGRVGRETMRAVVSILRDFRKRLDFYAVERVRAVATSAIREAANEDALLDRILIATGLDVEVIDPAEESRLAVSAVRQAVGAEVIGGGSALVADVGGGSTLLTVLEGGEISLSQSLDLGSIRMQEALSTAGEPPGRAVEILAHRIAAVVTSVQSTLPLKRIKTFVAVGGDARFAAKQVGEAADSGDLYLIDQAGFNELVDRCAPHTAEELTKRYGLSFAGAETLGPALLVYRALMQATRAKRMIVSAVSMRDGLLLDLARTVTGGQDDALYKGVVHSGMAVAEKYKVDLGHARNVASLALNLFDELQDEHGMSARHRLLLHVAALVHEVGAYVSTRAHHKHSYYLITNSEIFGLTRDEMLIVAHVARYHRRNPPRPTHVDYMNLPREKRVLVSKLAALLRVGDALDCDRAQQVRRIRCAREGEELVISVPDVTDLTLERRALADKGDLFEDIYGMRVRVEEG